MGLHYKPKNRS